MEFTQVLKKGSAVLFLVLLTHGLILGFSVSTTILSVVLAAVVCLFEAQLVKSERLEQEQRLNNIVRELQEHVNNLSKTQTEDKKEVLNKIQAQAEDLVAKIQNTDSKIQTIKLSQGIRKL